MKSHFLKGNIYWVLVLRLLIIFFIYTLCRVVFYEFNNGLFGSISFSKFSIILLGGLKFDVSAIFYLNLLFIFSQIIPFKFRYNSKYQKVCAYLFFIINGIGIAANIADISYYPFTLKRTTFTVFSQFAYEQNKFHLFWKFLLDFWYLSLFFIALMFLMVYTYGKLKVKETFYQKKPILYYSSGLISMALIVWVVIAGLRGGFLHSTRPITLSNAGEFVEQPAEINIVLNTPFALIRTIKTKVFKKANYFTNQNELNSIYTPIHIPKDSLAFTPKNVVVIILESFSKEYLGVFNKDLNGGQYKGYTPFLDSMASQSLIFQNAYANGRKSIEGLPSVIASIPGVEEPFVLSNYSGNKVNSFGSLLASKGYHTSFFHGAANGSMGFSSFVKMAGVQHYYGKTEYNNDDDFDGMWGIWDVPFMQFWGKTLNTFKQPFFSTLFSVSSHHPFKIPEEYEGKFPKGTLPVHQGVGYTDFSLRHFFKTISTMPWYKNTIFVITADHSSVAWNKEYKNTMGAYAVPIIVFDPSGKLKGVENKPVQQIDIMPGILSYLHFDKPYFAYGENLFNISNEHAVIHYVDDVYQIIQGDYILKYDGEKILSIYNYRKDRLMKHDLLGKNPAIEQKMLQHLKAFIQQYNNNMIDNTLTVK